MGEIACSTAKILILTYAINCLFNQREKSSDGRGRMGCKRFSVGRESTEDDQRPGRLVTVSGVETVTKINKIVRADRRMSIRMTVEAVNADKETVR
ncbi:hypothetical protein TNCV_4762551 [Trichonephila clavipes]|nr:hypothetical protein TNCV_4762551 [Trichonephila clavipes]